MLKIGIVGLPNVGKSTLFNALLKRQAALAANYPFATIEPNVGVVDVPDTRLDTLAEFVRNDHSVRNQSREVPEKITPTTIEFYDIAGLVKGASQGEGLGNEFLGHIREVEAIVQVVRDFSDTNVIRAGSVDPDGDVGTINTELILADIQSLEKRLEKLKSAARGVKDKEVLQKLEVALKLQETLNSGALASSLDLTEEEKILSKDLNLLTQKPMIYILNTDESGLNTEVIHNEYLHSENSLKICAKIEEELGGFSPEERKEYLKDLGIQETGLDKIIKAGYDLLELDTYLTMGPKEVRAWTIKKGTKAPQAAGVIHTDFERGFISAEVVNFEILEEIKSLKIAKEKGYVRLEGKNYVVKDGDIVEFRFSV